MLTNFILIALIAILVQSAISTSSTFRGAVANHISVSGSGSIKEDVNENLRQYKLLADKAATRGAEVIVFPEFGLAPCGTKNRTALSLTAEKIGGVGGVPCDDFTAKQIQEAPILYQMSCAAKEAHIAALVNMIDYVECDNSTEDCPSDGFYLYNTDVGLSATGEFQAKYHKSHEYFGLKPQFNVPTTPDYEVWTINNLNFGLFTCYDIFHKDPPKKYIANGVKYFLYPVQMGEIGDVTEIALWSKHEKATLFVSNTAVIGHKDVSGVYVNGKKQSGELVPIIDLDTNVDSESQQSGSVFVADVPVQ